MKYYISVVAFIVTLTACALLGAVKPVITDIAQMLCLAAAHERAQELEIAGKTPSQWCSDPTIRAIFLRRAKAARDNGLRDALGQ